VCLCVCVCVCVCVGESPILKPQQQPSQRYNLAIGFENVNTQRNNSVGHIVSPGNSKHGMNLNGSQHKGYSLHANIWNERGRPQTTSNIC
jgi:hypothetical protein